MERLQVWSNRPADFGEMEVWARTQSPVLEPSSGDAIRSRGRGLDNRPNNYDADEGRELFCVNRTSYLRFALHQ